MTSRLWRLSIGQFATVLMGLTLGILAKSMAADCIQDPYRFARSEVPALEKKYSKSVVLVNCGGDLTQSQIIGTGFLIDSRAGLFLTALHVVKKEGHYDCTKSDSRIVAYPMGDMCQPTDLEYVDSHAGHDVALLRVRNSAFASKTQPSDGSTTQPLKHFFSDEPHFELLTRAVTVNEAKLVLIGFSQFAANVQSGDERVIAKLPGVAGGHQCGDEPQPYKFNPVILDYQQIDAPGPSFLRDSRVHEGDSGAPVFLTDGRVGGMVTEIGLGDLSPGTRVTPASDIATWLVSVVGSNPALKDAMYSLERWSEDRNIFNALNPDACLSSHSCVPNIRIAAELQRIPENAVKFETFTKQRQDKLRCPLYTAAMTRDIPQADYLRKKLEELKVGVASSGYVDLDQAIAVLASPKYTTYTKIMALGQAEASLARDLDALWQTEPDAVAGAICAPGLSADRTEVIKGALNDYLDNFRWSNFAKGQSKSDKCPTNYDNMRAKQAKDLIAMISDVKVDQASLLKKAGGANDSGSPAPAIALSALVNFGAKQGAKALVDLGDAFADESPNLAAGAYASAFKVVPSVRAIAGFGDVVSRSPDLQAGKWGGAGGPSPVSGSGMCWKDRPANNGRDIYSGYWASCKSTKANPPPTFRLNDAISSFPPIEQDLVATTIERGLLPGPTVTQRR